MKCERCGKINPAEIHTCTPEPQVNGWPLYSGLPQREWKWLTDEEIEQIVDTHWNDPSMFVEAIEAKLKEKNS